MNINIGENIKRLRKEQDITQERLAEYLSISHQAVSKWESGDVFPDITLLPKLSNIFGVTLDTLFGMENKAPSEAIEEISKKVDLFYIGNQLKEAEMVLREGLEQYPRCYELMIKLATVLRNRHKEKNEKEKSLLIESIAKCNTVLSECSNDELRYKARRGLAISYCMCGEQEKAMEMAECIPITDDIMIYLLSGDERIKRCQQNILDGIEKITSRITHLADLNRAKGNFEYALYYLKLAENIFDLVFENKDFLDLADARNLINFNYGKIYSTLGQYDKCIEYLKTYVLQAIGIPSIPEKEKHSSRALNMLHFNLSRKSYKLAMINQAKTSLKDPIFDPIREMPEFIDILELLNT